MINRGDLVKFWDYELGDGFVYGIVVNVSATQFRSDSVAIPTATVLYKGALQSVPMDDEWIKVIDQNKD